jgi:tricorn protease
LALCALPTLAAPARAETAHPLLLQKPAVSATQIVFSYAGDLWSVGRNGGEAKRLTSSPGTETDPVFSPDGSQIAFTGEYDGNTDVYVMLATGGSPKRLTYHPGADVAVGWTPDGKQVLFRSSRDSASRFNRLYTVPVEGGLPTAVDLPMAEEGSFSPDGKRLAYLPIARAFQAWKRYRGGRTTKIWIANLSDAAIERVPRENSNDFNPMWVGNRVYFLSDRSGPVTLFAYDTTTKRVSQVLKNSGLDIKSAGAGPGAIAYEQFGSLHLLDLASGKEKPLDVRITADMPLIRPHFENVSKRIGAARLSPTGARAVFEAHGEILTVPADKGDVRNLTNTPGVAERDPSWSPDGKTIAYLSDESGEYALHLRSQNGMGEVRKISLEPSFYYGPTWSPDSKKIAVSDKRLNLWYVDLDHPQPKKVTTDTYAGGPIVPSWSPDSKWLAYAKQLKSHMRAVFLYSLETGQETQVTDGMSDARFPLFDKNGKYLYFTASTDVGPALAGIDMAGFNRPVTRSVYVVVLGKDLPSPLAPESDEEKAEAVGGDKPGMGAGGSEAPKPGGAESGRSAPKAPVTVRVDLDGIGQRILALPIPARNYADMATGKTGVLFLLESAPGPAGGGGGAGPAGLALHQFDLATRKVEKMMDGVSEFDVSFNGEKMLVRVGDRWSIMPAAARPAGAGPAAAAAAGGPGGGALKLDAMEVYVDPRAEWRQMYHEVWRIERDFFYDPHFHGLDLKAAEKYYEPYLNSLESRADLNYLFQEALGELSVGHLFVFGGEMPEVTHVAGGLLGSDYAVDNGRYKITRVYSGENWNPQLRAPLTQPGVNVKAGEYLLAVNGRDVRAPDSIYRFFEGTAGKQTVLKVGPNADGSGAREVTVVPVESETALRHLAWIEENRRKVAQMTDGRVAYVYLPDTSAPGYTSFNRYYYAQVGKDAAVIDERFNGGGMLADYIINAMRVPLLAYLSTREGEISTSPAGAIFGPKVMIINEYAGSGGDAMPWYFRKTGLGPLVGMRTWGGLVGIGGYPELMDGGMVTAPRVAVYDTNGELNVENHGITPDVEVEFDPRAWRAGHDPQLEKAVAIVMQQLKEHPLPVIVGPRYPNYHGGKESASGK